MTAAVLQFQNFIRRDEALWRASNILLLYILYILFFLSFNREKAHAPRRCTFRRVQAGENLKPKDRFKNGSTSEAEALPFPF